MEKLKCLGCEGDPRFFFVLSLHDLRGGAELKSRTFGACVDCSTPGSLTYDGLRKRLATLLFMQKNVLLGMAAEKPTSEIFDAIVAADRKTAAAGG
jgi:hypothetical protein